jgi:hypothetical protein
MMSSITNEAVDELGIKAEDSVTVVDQSLRRHDRGGLTSGCSSSPPCRALINHVS